MADRDVLQGLILIHHSLAAELVQKHFEPRRVDQTSYTCYNAAPTTSFIVALAFYNNLSRERHPEALRYFKDRSNELYMAYRDADSLLSDE